jgi:hypothetical protein
VLGDANIIINDAAESSTNAIRALIAVFMRHYQLSYIFFGNRGAKFVGNRLGENFPRKGGNEGLQDEANQRAYRRALSSTFDEN